MNAYHLFREKDACFVYHLDAGRFIRVSLAAYELLELRGSMSATDAEVAFRARHPDAADVLKEVSTLEAEGFFEPVDAPVKDGDEFEAELNERFSSHCNTLVLSVASGCNLACRYCYCGVCRDELPNKGLMPEAMALQAVKRLFAAADPKMGVRVTFFGGEPLLNKPVVEKVVARCNELAAARGQSVGYSITTNATLMDDETADLIVKNNFGLMASLDGPQPLHDGQCPTRDGRGSFAAAAAGIRLLLSCRFFKAARDLSYPIIYKAYPGLGHEGSAKVTELGFTCFEFALAEQARATQLAGGKFAKPDWSKIFKSADYVADVFNQSVYPKADAICVPPEFRMFLPAAIREAWIGG